MMTPSISARSGTCRRRSSNYHPRRFQRPTYSSCCSTVRTPSDTLKGKEHRAAHSITTAFRRSSTPSSLFFDNSDSSITCSPFFCSVPSSPFTRGWPQAGGFIPHSAFLIQHSSFLIPIRITFILAHPSPFPRGNGSVIAPQTQSGQLRLSFQLSVEGIAVDLLIMPG